MAQTNDNKGSLNDFSFDTDDNWFGVGTKPGEDQNSNVIKEVKSAGTTSSTGAVASTKIDSNTEKTVFDDEVDEDDDKVTTFFDQELEDEIDDEKPIKKKSKRKLVTKDADNPDEVEEGEDNEITNLDDKNVKNKDEEDLEDEDLEEEKDKKGVKRGSSQETKDVDETDDKEFFSNLTKDLKERGILQGADIKEDEVDTEDKFFEHMENEIETRVTEAFEDFYSKLDEDAVRFLKFKKEGGNTTQFFSMYATPIDYDNFDEKDSNQIQTALVHYLTTVEELDGDDLQERLQWLKDGGKEKATAIKYVAKLKLDRDKKIEGLQSAAEKAKEKKNKDAEDFDKELIEVLENTENVGVFPITKEDHKKLRPFFTKATVKVGKNKYVPEFQNKLANILRAATKEDKQRLLMLGKIIEEDFNVKDLAKEVTTNVTRKVKSNIRSGKDRAKVRSSVPSGSKTISDFF